MSRLSDEQIQREIEQLRTEAEVCAFPANLLVAYRYHQLVRKIASLADELRRRECQPRPKRKRSLPKSVARMESVNRQLRQQTTADRANAEAEARLLHILETP